jgi:uncharacterized protein
MFYRRMAALLAIGMVHGMLIWRGDILTAYALAGAVLALLRRLSPRGLLIAAAAALAVAPSLEFFAVSAFHIALPTQPSQSRVDWVYMHGSIAQIAAMGREGYLFWYRRWAPFVLPPFLSLFLLGFCAAKMNLLQRLAGQRRVLRRICLSAAAGTVLCYGLIALLAYLWQGPASQPVRHDPLRQSAFWVLGQFPPWCGAAMYAAGLALIASFAGGGRRLRPLAAVGRMSLTTYLTQSLISVTLFYHFGLGWYGHATYPGVFAITVVVFSAQMCVSVWWLNRFRFGPMEWVWRSMAYLKRQPMRREPDSKAVAA